MVWSNTSRLQPRPVTAIDALRRQRIGQPPRVLLQQFESEISNSPVRRLVNQGGTPRPGMPVANRLGNIKAFGNVPEKSPANVFVGSSGERPSTNHEGSCQLAGRSTGNAADCG